jgi:hypothetical protein
MGNVILLLVIEEFFEIFIKSFKFYKTIQFSSLNFFISKSLEKERENACCNVLQRFLS